MAGVLTAVAIWIKYDLGDGLSCFVTFLPNALRFFPVLLCCERFRNITSVVIRIKACNWVGSVGYQSLSQVMEGL
jgi:hypothetical protein